MNSVLLLIIIAILLFGSGVVLGFFSTIFWIIVAITVIAGLIWFVVSLPKIGKDIVQDEVNTIKKGYQKHPTYTVIFWIIGIIFFLWLIIAWRNQSSNATVIDTQFQPYISTTPQEEVKQYEMNLEKARAAGATDEQIQEVLQSRPDVHVYPDINRDAFLTNCYKESENNITACTCLLAYFEARYTIDEFLQIEDEYVKTQKYPEAMINAMQYCVK